jgi:hypothetical protein
LQKVGFGGTGELAGTSFTGENKVAESIFEMEIFRV